MQTTQGSSCSLQRHSSPELIIPEDRSKTKDEKCDTLLQTKKNLLISLQQ